MWIAHLGLDKFRSRQGSWVHFAHARRSPGGSRTGRWGWSLQAVLSRARGCARRSMEWFLLNPVWQEYVVVCRAVHLRRPCRG